ncbi:MAG: histidine phosphatase family protein [Thiotrichales bacterium]|nr:histidine phosphatase family protein [Thiotrichales bacterium]
MQIEVIRHGACADDAFLRGRTDSPLSDLGWRQMEAAVANLPRPEWIISSPLQRCAAFADQFAAKTQSAFVTDCAWQERDFGLWDGLSLSQLQHQEGSALAAYLAEPFVDQIPQAEPLADFSQRVEQAWNELCHRTETSVWLITHGGVQRSLLHSLLGIPLERSFHLQLGYAARLSFVVTPTASGPFCQLQAMVPFAGNA